MPRVLLTAFEAYDPWPQNASWLALVELTRDMPSTPTVTTRLYPVDLTAAKERLETDLKAKYDFILHVGQVPHSSCIQLEEIAINVSTQGQGGANYEAAGHVCDGPPVAYHTPLPVSSFAKTLRKEGIPARVSFHAGTYLCNAIFYWSCRLAEELELPTKSTFVHVPLETSQVIGLDQPSSFMPAAMTARALRLLLKVATSDASRDQLA